MAVGSFPQQHLDGADDEAQGSAQLVAHGREKAALELVGFFRQAPAFLCDTARLLGLSI